MPTLPEKRRKRFLTPVVLVYEDVHCAATDGNYPRLQKAIYPNGREVYYKYTDAVGATMRRGTMTGCPLGSDSFVSYR